MLRVGELEEDHLCFALVSRLSTLNWTPLSLSGQRRLTCPNSLLLPLWAGLSALSLTHWSLAQILRTV